MLWKMLVQRMYSSLRFERLWFSCSLFYFFICCTRSHLCTVHFLYYATRCLSLLFFLILFFQVFLYAFLNSFFYHSDNYFLYFLSSLFPFLFHSWTPQQCVSPKLNAAWRYIWLLCLKRLPSNSSSTSFSPLWTVRCQKNEWTVVPVRKVIIGIMADEMYGERFALRELQCLFGKNLVFCKIEIEQSLQILGGSLAIHMYELMNRQTRGVFFHVF